METFFRKRNNCLQGPRRLAYTFIFFPFMPPDTGPKTSSRSFRRKFRRKLGKGKTGQETEADKDQRQDLV